MSGQPETSKRGILAVLAAAIIWGTSFLLIDKTVDQLDLIYEGVGYAISLFYRLLFAFLSSLLVYIAVNVRQLKSELFYFKRRNVYVLTLLNVGGYFFQFLGAALTESAKLALLVNANIILVPILSYLWLHESMNYRKVGGMMMGVVGLFLVTTGGLFGPIVEGELVGNLISMCGGLCWAVYIVLSRKMLAQQEAEYKPLNLSLVTTFLSFVVLLPLLFIYYGPLTAIVFQPSFPWWELVYLGIICTTLAYIFYSIGIKLVSATNACYLLLAETIVGVFLGIFVGGDLFTVYTIIGTVLVFASIIVINLS